MLIQMYFQIYIFYFFSLLLLYNISYFYNFAFHISHLQQTSKRMIISAKKYILQNMIKIFAET